MTAELGLAALQSVLLAALPTAQFAASPIQWSKLLPARTAVPEFLQRFAFGNSHAPAPAQRIESQGSDQHSVERSRLWPTDPKTRVQRLCEIVTDTAESIIGRTVDANEPLMAAGEM